MYGPPRPSVGLAAMGIHNQTTGEEHNMNWQKTDVAIIGAGPSGAVAAAFLRQRGYRVLVLERQQFPRFSIGESLLPHCMEILAEADMAAAVAAAGFQFKNGAAFTWGTRNTFFDFTDKFTPGPGTTFQVQRAQFDQILIDEAARQGAEVRFRHSVTAVALDEDAARLQVTDDVSGSLYGVEAAFVLDASGYGRMLPRLLDLEVPSSLPMRQAYFTHIEDRISDDSFDRNKILISTHPRQRDVWLWFIPFSNGRSSIGVVGTPQALAQAEQAPGEATLKHYVGEIPRLSGLLQQAVWDTPVNSLSNYSANVKTLHGHRFALLGNAAEFLDPVFSSGVTIAMHSAKLATELLHRQLQGERVDWQTEFAEPLMIGVNAFRTYVTGWYDGSFQDVIYSKNIEPDIRRMLSAILAGYAWDTNNPYVAKSDRRLQALAQVCGAADAE